MIRAAHGLGSGASGVGDVHLAQETARPDRSKPWQVKPRGVYVARVACPAEGAAMLAEKLASGNWPRGRATVRLSCGMWEVRLVALGRGGRRGPWLRHFRHFCDAVRGLQEMRRVSDDLERRALFEAEAALRAVVDGP